MHCFSEHFTEVSWSLTSLFSTNMAISETNISLKTESRAQHFSAYFIESNIYLHFQ